MSVEGRGEDIASVADAAAATVECCTPPVPIPSKLYFTVVLLNNVVHDESCLTDRCLKRACVYVLVFHVCRVGWYKEIFQADQKLRACFSPSSHLLSFEDSLPEHNTGS